MGWSHQLSIGWTSTDTIPFMLANTTSVKTRSPERTQKRKSIENIIRFSQILLTYHTKFVRIDRSPTLLVKMIDYLGDDTQ